MNSVIFASLARENCLGTKIECSYRKQVLQLWTLGALAYSHDAIRTAFWPPPPKTVPEHSMSSTAKKKKKKKSTEKLF